MQILKLKYFRKDGKHMIKSLRYLVNNVWLNEIRSDKIYSNVHDLFFGRFKVRIEVTRRVQPCYTLPFNHH